MDYDEMEYEPKDIEFDDDEELVEEFVYVAPVKPVPAPVQKETASPVPRPLSGNPPPTSAPPGWPIPEPEKKPERHPILLGIVLLLLLYLFVGGCQEVGKPGYTPRSTPRPTPTPMPHPVPSYRVGTVRPSGDPYHADDYVHPDDFYYEYRDDFSDYEEAEEYWEEHH